MSLFRVRCWPWGPNLLAAGLYSFSGRHMLVIWFLNHPARSIRFGAPAPRSSSNAAR